MDFLNGKIRPMYRKYLAAAFGSAMITSVYSIVDTAMVGQYHGPGNGGAGRSGLGRTAGFSGACADFFRGGCVHTGAGGEVYGADPVCVPAVFVQPDALGVFAQRQEPGPCHTGRAVGGLFNVFGDYFFVFTCDMGIYGAVLATAIGSGISFLVMMTHFVRSKNTFFGVFWTTLSMAYPNLYMVGLRQRTLLDGNDLFIEFKGALTEQYVCQRLKTIEDLGVYYYTNDRGSCEIHIF